MSERPAGQNKKEMPEKSVNVRPAGAAAPEQQVPEPGARAPEGWPAGGCDYMNRPQTALWNRDPPPLAPSLDFPLSCSILNTAFPNCAGSFVQKTETDKHTETHSVSKRKD